METVVPNPHYEFPTAGWAVDGQEAVREHYRRSLPAGGRSRVASKKRVHGAGPNTLFREAPGVTRLNANAAPITPEEMMAEVRKAIAAPES